MVARGRYIISTVAMQWKGLKILYNGGQIKYADIYCFRLGSKLCLYDSDTYRYGKTRISHTN